MHAVHGGAFFDAIGIQLNHLDRKDGIISGDVLDAWYDPSPRVVEAIQAHLPWLIKTSPPTHGEGLREVLAEERGIPSSQILLGAGSSALMFLALPRLISRSETALILDPSYGEYAHLFEQVIGCQVRRHELNLTDFRPDIDALARDAQGADLLVVVNPNSPTGVGISRADLERLLSLLPSNIKVWVDETYIEFMAGAQSLESLVASDPRVIVSKSMSKVYGLSGLRLGYLVADPALIEQWERYSPPWSVGLLAQLAGIEALRDRGYYATRFAETHALREALVSELASYAPFHPFRADANYVMVRSAVSVQQIAESLKASGVFLRNCDSLSPRFHDDHFRVAVKDAATQRRLLDAFAKLGLS